MFKHRVKAQLSMLTTMFLLGMAVNLIGVEKDDLGKIWTAGTIFTLLHIFVAIGLLVNSLLVIRMSLLSNKKLTKLTWVGAVVTVATFVSGILTLAFDNDWWSYAMAAGFIASFWIYGSLLFKTRTAE